MTTMIGYGVSFCQKEMHQTHQLVGIVVVFSQTSSFYRVVDFGICGRSETVATNSTDE